MDQVLETRGLGKPGFAFLEVQRDPRAAVVDPGRLDRELTLAVRLPANALGRVQAGAPGFDDDTIGHDEGGIKADAELANEPGVLFFVAGHAAQEFRGAGTRDSAEIFHELVARHADAVIGDADGARVLVVLDANPELGIVAEQLRCGERLETQLVCSIRGVRNKFAKEYLLVAVQRVDHQLQKLTNLCLEAERLSSIVELVNCLTCLNWLFCSQSPTPSVLSGQHDRGWETISRCGARNQVMARHTGIAKGWVAERYISVTSSIVAQADASGGCFSASRTPAICSARAITRNASATQRLRKRSASRRRE